jgi:hypothetical protein
MPDAEPVDPIVITRVSVVGDPAPRSVAAKPASAKAAAKKR